ncbi:MAG: hypothetical protein GEU87_13660 [Alphaproteobacteria bacterium]|nr:hypothetical protein [Alphaproteobacteria bacterium]
MTDVLITIDPATGLQLREPWNRTTPAEDMARAARRLKQGRDHDRCGRKPCMHCIAGSEHPDCPRKSR